jgi:hypothetical protein
MQRLEMAVPVAPLRAWPSAGRAVETTEGECDSSLL